MTRKINATLFSFLLLAVSWTLSCNRSGPANPIEAPTSGAVILQVATSGDYRPFSDWEASSPEPEGFSVDVARAFARDSHLEIEWSRFGWPSLLTNVSEERFDVAISGITVRSERSVAGLFSLPLTTSGAVVLVRDADPTRSVEALNQPGVRLAVNAGGHLERVAHRLFPRAIVEAVPRNAEVLARLRDDDVDGVVTDTLEAPHWQARAKQALRRIGPLTQDRKAALFPPTRPALAQRFDDWLSRAETSGQLTRLRRKHGLPTNPTAALIPALLASLDERLSLMPSVARVKRILDLEVEDLEREARVLDAARGSVERAARTGGGRVPNRDAVERLFRAQIEAAKWIQRAVLQGELEVTAGSVEEADSASDPATRAREELDEALRPALIRLGDRISRLVAKLGESGAERPEFAMTAEALARHGLPETHLRALHESLLSLLQSATEPASTRPPPPAGPDTAPSA